MFAFIMFYISYMHI